MKRTTKLIGIILAIALAVTAVFMKGIYDGSGGKELSLTRQAVAAQAKSTASPVKGCRRWCRGRPTEIGTDFQENVTPSPQRPADVLKGSHTQLPYLQRLHK